MLINHVVTFCISYNLKTTLLYFVGLLYAIPHSIWIWSSIILQFFHQSRLRESIHVCLYLSLILPSIEVKGIYPCLLIPISNLHFSINYDLIASPNWFFYQPLLHTSLGSLSLSAQLKQPITSCKCSNSVSYLLAYYHLSILTLSFMPYSFLECIIFN